MTKKHNSKQRNSKSVLFLIGIVFFIIIIITGISFVVLRSLRLNVSEQSTALLIINTPEVSVERNGETKIVQEEEFELVVGDKVKTNSGALAYIIFEDNSSITLDEKTEIEIQKMAEGNENFEVEIFQLIGKTWSRVENLVNKDSSYQVETSNTIAAVRGTQFECNVADDGTTECNSVEHDIDLTLKNLNKFTNKFVLKQGKRFVNNGKFDDISSLEELKKLIKEVKEKDNNWTKFNICLHQNVRKLIKLDKNRILNYIRKNRDELLLCMDVLGQTTIKEWVINKRDSRNEEKENQTTTINNYNGNLDPTTSIDENEKKYPLIKNVSLSQDDDELHCTWNSIDSDYFKVSLGTSPGAADIYPWFQVSDQSEYFDDIPPGQTYYCNVKGFGNNRWSRIVSSNKVYFDQSSGYFEETNPCYPSFFDDTVYGTGKYEDADFSHIKVEFYIKGENGKYYKDNGDWVSEKYWLVADLSDDGDGLFSFIRENLNIYDEVLEIRFVLYNKQSGKILDDKTCENIYCYI